MLIFDELKKNDPQLRLRGGGAGRRACSFCWPACGGCRSFPRANMKAIWKRSRIAPCAFPPCAEKFWTATAACWPRTGRSYNLSLYLDDLRKQFDAAYGQSLAQARAVPETTHRRAGEKTGPFADEGRAASNSRSRPAQLRATPRTGALQRGQRRGRAGRPNGSASRWRSTQRHLTAHYETRLALPYPLLPNLNDGADRAVRGAIFRQPGRRTWNCKPSAFIRTAPRRHICSAICSATTVPRKAKTPISIIVCRIIAAWSGIEGGFDAQLRGRAGRGSRAGQQSRLPPDRKHLEPARAGPQRRADD